MDGGLGPAGMLKSSIGDLMSHNGMDTPLPINLLISLSYRWHNPPCIAGLYWGVYPRGVSVYML